MYKNDNCIEFAPLYSAAYILLIHIPIQGDDFMIMLQHLKAQAEELSEMKTTELSQVKITSSKHPIINIRVK